MISSPPFKIPAAPTPDTALPTINIVELVANPQSSEPSSKIPRKTKNVYLRLKSQRKITSNLNFLVNGIRVYLQREVSIKLAIQGLKSATVRAALRCVPRKRFQELGVKNLLSKKVSTAIPTNIVNRVELGSNLGNSLFCRLRNNSHDSHRTLEGRKSS